MGRPKGFVIDQEALTDRVYALRLSMTEAAERCQMPLGTFSYIANGGGASMRSVRAISDGLGCDAEKLFPELASSRGGETEAVA